MDDNSKIGDLELYSHKFAVDFADDCIDSQAKPLFLRRAIDLAEAIKDLPEQSDDITLKHIG